MNNPTSERVHTSQSKISEALYSISEMAQEFGVTLRALRFYEDKLLLSPIRVGVARLYDERARNRLRTILKAKVLGFTLSEIRDLLTSSEVEESMGCDLVLSPDQVESQLTALEHRRAQIDAAIEELRIASKRMKEEENRGPVRVSGAA